MKKILLTLVPLVFLTLASPTLLKAEEDPCYTKVLTCPNGTQHTVFYCGTADWWAWADILCGIPL